MQERGRVESAHADFAEPRPDDAEGNRAGKPKRTKSAPKNTRRGERVVKFLEQDLGMALMWNASAGAFVVRSVTPRAEADRHGIGARGSDASGCSGGGGRGPSTQPKS